MKRMVFATVALAAMCAFATQKFAYKGQLERADGASFDTSLPMTMAFRLYNRATGGSPLWGRTMRVRVETNGTFYVELADDRGSASDKNLPYAEIADALASGGETFYFGLTPGEYSELSPRQQLVSVPRALCAISADKIVDLKAQTLSADVVRVGNATIANVAVSDTFQHLSQNVSMDVANNATVSAQDTIKITGGIDGVRQDDAYNFTIANGIPTYADTFVVIDETLDGDIPQDGNMFSLFFPASAGDTAYFNIRAFSSKIFSFGKRD